MKKSIIRQKLNEMIMYHFKLELDGEKNILDEVPAYHLLYLVKPIEEIFQISMQELFENSDDSMMTINALTEKIWKVQHDKNRIY